MIFHKHLFLFALIALVIAVVKTEEEKDEKLENLPVPRAQNALSSKRYSQAQILTILARTRRILVRLEARVRSLEARGVAALRGRDGRDGMPGKPGKDGRDGKDGKQGARGPRGLRGARGKNGARGPQGPRGGGVQYVRWGKTSCPRGSSLVYKGSIGSGHYAHRGGGVNYVCLTENPKYKPYAKPGFQYGGLMYGTEYEVSHNAQLFKNRRLHDHDAPCAVCYVSSRTAKLMIPGTYECPSGWRREYWGNLMSAHYNHPHPSEFVCVDWSAETEVGSRANRNGALLYPVEGSCGSLPCNPYKNGLELTCAVCTK